MTTAPDHQLAALAATQYAQFSHEQAIAIGFGRGARRHRVRAGRWEVVVPRRVYRFPGAPESWRQQLMAAVLEVGPDAAASHRSAAALFGLPGFAEGPLEVTARESRDHVVRLSRLHRSSALPAHHRTVVDGITCTTLARCLFDLAGREHPLRVQRAFENAVAQLGLSPARVEEAVTTLAGRGRPGSAVMRKLLDTIDEGYVPPASELEALLLTVLADRGVELPALQVAAGGDTLVGRVDFLYRRARLIIECQSRRYHSSWSAQLADMERRARLTAAGWRVLEITWWQLVHHPDEVAALVRTALAHAA